MHFCRVWLSGGKSCTNFKNIFGVSWSKHFVVALEVEFSCNRTKDCISSAIKLAELIRFGWYYFESAFNLKAQIGQRLVEPTFK
jgi:hypothetical protein